MSIDIEPTNTPTERTAWFSSTATSVVTTGITFGVWASVSRHGDVELPDSRLLLAATLLVYLPLLFVVVRKRFTLRIAIPYGIAFGLLCVVAIPAALTLIGWQ